MKIDSAGIFAIAFVAQFVFIIGFGLFDGLRKQKREKAEKARIQKITDDHKKRDEYKN